MESNKNWKRKISALGLSVVTVFSLSCPAFASSVNDVSSKAVALEQGMSVLESSGMSTDTIASLFTNEEVMEYADMEYIGSSETQYIKFSHDGSVASLTESEFIEGAAAETERREAAVQSILSSRATSIDKGEQLDKLADSFDGYLSWSLSVYRRYNVEETYHLIGSYEWETTPSALGNDVFAVTYNKNLTYCDDYAPSYSFYSKIYMLSGSTLTPVGHVSVDDEDRLTFDDGGVGVVQDLKEDVPSDGFGYSYVLENVTGQISYDVIVDNSSATAATVYAQYYHQKNETNVAISISIPLGGGISLSNSTYHEKATGNPRITFAVNE